MGHAGDDIQPSEGCVCVIWERGDVELGIRGRMSGRTHWERRRRVGVSNSSKAEERKPGEVVWMQRT